MERCCSGQLSHLLLPLVTVGIPSYFRRRWNLDPGKRVDAPALAPLAVGGHVALEREREREEKNTN